MFQARELDDFEAVDLQISISIDPAAAAAVVDFDRDGGGGGDGGVKVVSLRRLVGIHGRELSALSVLVRRVG